MDIRALRPDEFAQWTAHCDRVFTDTPEEYFVRHFNCDPYKDYDGIFVAMDDGRIVSTVRAFCRAVYLRGCAVSMGGIGEVSTQPEYRRMGLSSALLARACDYMAAHKLDISFLFTGTNHHYARCGWHTVVNRYLSIRPENITAAAVPIRPFAPEDMPAIRGVYAMAAPEFDGLLVRERAYWDSWVAGEMRECFVHEGEIGVDAYIARGGSDDEPECLALPGAKELLPGMIKSYLVDTNADSVIASARYFDGLPGLAHCVCKEGTGIMVKLIAPFMLQGELITDPLELRRVCADLTFSPIDGF